MGTVSLVKRKTKPFCSLKYQHLHKISQDIGWRKLWDHTLDHGLHVVKAIKRVITYPWHATKSVHYVTLMFSTRKIHYIPEHSVAEHTISEGNCWTPWSPWTVHSVVMLDAFQMLFCFLFRCMSMPKRVQEYKTLTLSLSNSCESTRHKSQFMFRFSRVEF